VGKGAVNKHAPSPRIAQRLPTRLPLNRTDARVGTALRRT